MKNWLTYDPRIAKVERYDYCESKATIDWTTHLENKQTEFEIRDNVDSDNVAKAEEANASVSESKPAAQPAAKISTK